MELQELISQLADRAEAAGVDRSNTESVRDFIRTNCSYRPDTEFYIYFMLTCELADRHAQRQGFENQFDLALKGGAL